MTWLFAELEVIRERHLDEVRWILHHFLKFDDDTDVLDIQKRINSHTFPSNTTGLRSLSKSEINSVLNTLIRYE